MQDCLRHHAGVSHARLVHAPHPAPCTASTSSRSTASCTAATTNCTARASNHESQPWRSGQDRGPGFPAIAPVMRHGTSLQIRAIAGLHGPALYPRLHGGMGTRGATVIALAAARPDTNEDPRKRLALGPLFHIAKLALEQLKFCSSSTLLAVYSLYSSAQLALVQLYFWSLSSPLLGPLVRWSTKYQDVLGRCTVTVAMLVLIRSGLFIPLPGVDMQHIPTMGPTSEGERLVRALYGQSSALPASLFDLGISPFINSSILMSLILLAPLKLLGIKGQSGIIGWVVKLQEKRKEGSHGAAVIKYNIQGLAGALGLYQAIVRAIELEPHALFTGGFIFNTSIALLAGACIMHKASDFITAAGVGNGSTLIICAGIITEYAATIHLVLTGLVAGAVASNTLVGILAVYLLIVLLTIYLNTSKLKLPIIQYSSLSADEPEGGISRGDQFAEMRHITQKKLALRSTREDFFPVPLNTAGMMPIILAGAWCFGIQPRLLSFVTTPALMERYMVMANSEIGILYYGLCVFLTALVPLGGLVPKEIAEYFSAMNVGIRGVVPGEPTEHYLNALTMKTRFWGGLCLASLAVFAIAFDMVCQHYIGSKLGTTNLLIIVGAVLEISRQLEALLEGPRLQEKLLNEQKIIQALRIL